MEIESEQDLLRLRAELKKFKKTPAKKVLALLKSVRECPKINREWVRKTRVTKTLARIAQHKYQELDEVKIMIIKLSKYLLQKFQSLFPKVKQLLAESANKEVHTAKTEEKAQVLPSPQVASAEIPQFENAKRNQGLQGIIKYFQKGLDESLLKESSAVSVAIEDYINNKNTKENIFNEIGYKDDVKKLCTAFLDKENSKNLKTNAMKEFSIKKTGSLSCIISVLQ